VFVAVAEVCRVWCCSFCQEEDEEEEERRRRKRRWSSACNSNSVLHTIGLGVYCS
jgi:hypothetical protein